MKSDPKETGILFNGEMVRAIMSGDKTMTRRFVPDWQLPHLTKGDPVDGLEWISVAQNHPRWGFGVFGKTENECMDNYNRDYRSCTPYGGKGNRIYVRETTQADHEMNDTVVLAKYCADGKPVLYDHDEHHKNVVSHWWYSRDICPSIHMPKWAARTWLEITGMKVERLQDISEEDAKAEGAPAYEDGLDEPPPADGDYSWSYRASFRKLWISIYGQESWDSNPWVFAYKFKIISNKA